MTGLRRCGWIALAFFVSRWSLVAEESLNLFDGRTLDGWEIHGGAATFRVEDGCIVGRTAPRTANTFLCTTLQFDDFVLEYEFRVDPELNSGVQIRSFLRDDAVTGYQIEIDPDVARGRLWTGGIYEESGRGWLADLSDNQDARRAFRPGEWNHVRVRAEGARLRTWVNGTGAADLLDTRSLCGFIALQVHGVGERDDALEVRWRNLRLRALGAHRWRRRLDECASDWSCAVEPSGLTLAGSGEWFLPGSLLDPFSVRLRYRSASQESRFFFGRSEGGASRGWTTVLGAVDCGGLESADGVALIGPRVGRPMAPDGRPRWFHVTHAGRRVALHVDDESIGLVDLAVDEPGGCGGRAGVRSERGASLALEAIDTLEPVELRPMIGRPAPVDAQGLLGPVSSAPEGERGDPWGAWCHRSGGDEASVPRWKWEAGVIEVVPGAGSIETREMFTDFELHVEFSTSAGDTGNSGIYLQGRYEVQIFNSFEQPILDDGCGALYRMRAPDYAVARPPGEWQTYRITFRAPRWDDDGRRREAARITVRHNGVVVHDDVEIRAKTGAGRPESPTPGPIVLQDHGCPVRFRNIWVRRL
ncbi:MAG: DUF1080 domain-containing protein [Planctomycetes bacterium]|nr:DUF1080 domain-containing protein [Planctomycetota bacterium]